MEQINKGLDSLLKSILHDLKEHSCRECKFFSDDCLNKMKNYATNGGTLCEHNCEYCGKFKWVVDRAKHYAEKTGLTFDEILKGWEEKRNYWYMNYYQDCNQPELKEGTRVFDTIQDLLTSIGKEGFRCPCCGGISKNAYECDSGLEVTRDGKKTTCNWKAYGLFGCLGKGAYVYVKEKLAGENLFMPIAWEEKK